MAAATLTKKQREVLAALYANNGNNTYFRDIGILQPSAMVVAGTETIDRGGPTVLALERKGFVKVDRRRPMEPTYPIFVTVAGRDAL
jgi:DNA-binding MarR family transcriptional regulator